MSETTVLVTGVGATTGISVIKGLRQQQEFRVKVVGTDSNQANLIAGSSLCDVFHTVPLAADPNYLQSLLTICQRERVQLLIPIVDPEILVLTDNKEIFEKSGVQLVVSDPETVTICDDKYATVMFLKQHDIPTPWTMLAEEVADPKSLTYPVFMKPRHGVGSVNAMRVDSPQEFIWTKSRVSDMVVQEYLEGEEFTTDVLADFDGRVLAVVPRQRLETKSGISYKGRTCRDETLIHWGGLIAEVLNIRGPANIQCIVSKKMPIYFEVNPRFSGGLPLTIAAGVNGPWWTLKLMHGQKQPNGLLPFKEVVMTRYWMETFYHDSPLNDG
jgi:carbamoyl-phosphate synthase large subunit